MGEMWSMSERFDTGQPLWGVPEGSFLKYRSVRNSSMFRSGPLDNALVHRDQNQGNFLARYISTAEKDIYVNVPARRGQCVRIGLDKQDLKHEGAWQEQ